MIEQTKQLARDIGLHALGVAPAIDEVRRLFPFAESVIVAAISYLPPERDRAGSAPAGRVARFARLADYHSVLRSKLAILADSLHSHAANAKQEICVDTTPLPERKLAMLAGIAARGKNGNVFVDGCGSYTALGEIVTNLILPAAEGICFGTAFRPEACEGCDKCISACPTGAIIGSGVIDPSRCISHLTQMSGIIPRELRHSIGDRIHGCDTCQEVCPVNARIQPSSPEFAIEVFPGARPPLIPLLSLSPGEFNEYVRESPIGWIGRSRIRRNAAVAAGNLKCAEAVPALTDILQSRVPILAIHAAWALGKIGAVDALESALVNETDPSIIEEIRAALANK